MKGLAVKGEILLCTVHCTGNMYSDMGKTQPIFPAQVESFDKIFQAFTIKCNQYLPSVFPTVLSVAIVLASTMLGPALQTPFSTDIIRI